MATFMKYFSHNYLIIILMKFCPIIKIAEKKTNVVSCSLFFIESPSSKTLYNSYQLITAKPIQSFIN